MGVAHEDMHQVAADRSADANDPAVHCRVARRKRLTFGELVAILFCGFTLQFAIVLSGYWRPAQLGQWLSLWQRLAPG